MIAAPYWFYKLGAWADRRTVLIVLDESAPDSPTPRLASGTAPLRPKRNDLEDSHQKRRGLVQKDYGQRGRDSCCLYPSCRFLCGEAHARLEPGASTVSRSTLHGSNLTRTKLPPEPARSRVFLVRLRTHPSHSCLPTCRTRTIEKRTVRTVRVRRPFKERYTGFVIGAAVAARDGYSLRPRWGLRSLRKLLIPIIITVPATVAGFFMMPTKLVYRAQQTP